MVIAGVGWIVHLDRAARRLRDAMRCAEAANEAKSRFLTNMSHELRTPLNGMLGMAEALSLTRLTPEEAAQVRTLHGSSEALLVILNDILDLSTLEADRMEIAPSVADLGEICRGVVDIYRSAAEANRTELALTLDPGLPCALVLDGVRVRQCLSNLVSNAVKFTAEGRVAIDVRAAEDAASGRICVTMTVTDNDIGMSHDTMAGLFGSFMQADTSATRRFGGVGLGLSITQRLAKLMDGAILVESELGRGSVFTFTFLADPAAQGAEAPTPRDGEPALDLAPGAPVAPAAPGLLDGVRVLVVDDHPVNRRVATLLLQTLGCQIVEADDGASAIAQLAVQTFDLVLMDINMPIMDGLEATRRIRANPRWDDVAIVALTAGASEEHRRLCLAQGMNGYLTKPINSSALLGAISELAVAA
jgi:CheY-like chemotaxis protein/nitrogen-specific signal transduction histidine kinase